MGGFCIRLEAKLHHIVLIVNVRSVGGFCVRLESLCIETFVLNFVYSCFICT